jgi:hypothetical protein
VVVNAMLPMIPMTGAWLRSPLMPGNRREGLGAGRLVWLASRLQDQAAGEYVGIEPIFPAAIALERASQPSSRVTKPEHIVPPKVALGLPSAFGANKFGTRSCVLRPSQCGNRWCAGWGISATVSRERL